MQRKTKEEQLQEIRIEIIIKKEQYQESLTKYDELCKKIDGLYTELAKEKKNLLDRGEQANELIKKYKQLESADQQKEKLPSLETRVH